LSSAPLAWPLSSPTCLTISIQNGFTASMLHVAAGDVIFVNYSPVPTGPPAGPGFRFWNLRQVMSPAGFRLGVSAIRPPL
jgi:hypothetical protein